MSLMMPSNVFLRVVYWRPDYPTLLQTFEHQFLDLVPKIPRVHKFLVFWKHEIHAAINSVEVDIGDGNLRPIQFRRVDVLMNLQ